MPSKLAEMHRIEALRREIARHDRLYYVENAPEISDAAYDGLLAELEALEDKHPDLVTPDSPTQRVGAEPESALGRVEHLAPMLSLEAVREEEEVTRFLDRLRQETGEAEPALVAEPKYDGLSVEVVYEAGRFTRASTRGDGLVGEDISHTLKTVGALPLRLAGAEDLPGTLAVRGEAILPKESFQRVNKARAERGEGPFANPRNAAAGILRRLDPRDAAGVGFELLFYDATGLGAETDSQWRLLERLRELGLKVGAEKVRCASMQEAEVFHRRLREKRDALPYEIDGIVLKLDGLASREALGMRARSPRWALAWKLEPRREVTRIADITVSVGRTGVLTPVALLEPVDIGGVTVARATLHNAEEVARKDLRVGDTVRIERAGDVIPEVAERVPTPGVARSEPFELPKTCPACGAEVERRGPLAYCPAGIACPAQLKGRLLHYASRGAMDIDGLGEKIAEQLVGRGMVEDIADLYDLAVEDLEGLDGFAKTSARKLHGAIHDRRAVPLDRFLVALGIRQVGGDAARRLARTFGSLDAMRKAGRKEIEAVAGIGAETAESVTAFFAEERNREVLDRLLAAWVAPQLLERAGSTLAGKTFVLTGSLEGFTREEATEEIERRGGRVTSSISGKTDCIVVGAEPGSKLEDAKAKGVRIVDEAEFRRMLK